MSIESLEKEIAQIYGANGRRRYGLEEISQLRHALQAAAFAEEGGEPPAMVLAALLHDVGHMIHGMGENPAGEGVDDRHEELGADWLARRLGNAVSEPVRLHVAAKRYLCATDEGYMAALAPDSVLSLKLQGGPMTESEAKEFLARPYAQDALRLRRFDERAKDKDARTPGISHFLRNIRLAGIGSQEREAFAKDGVLVLRNYLSEEEARAFRQHSGAMGIEAAGLLAAAARAGRSPADMAQANGQALIVVPEADDPGRVCRFEYLQGANDTFRALVATTIVPAIDALGGEVFVPFKDKENGKHPGGGAFGAHQDYAAYQSFGPRYNITAMVTIDSANLANGCLEFASGWVEAVRALPDAVESWTDGRALLRHHKGGAQNGDVLDSIAGRLDWRAVETGPRDLVIFDSFVPHRSKSNRSESSRRAMFLTFNAKREGEWYARYYGEKRERFNDPKFHVSTPTAHD